MVRKQVKALTVLYLVPCQHFGVYFAPYQILLVMGAHAAAGEVSCLVSNMAAKKLNCYKVKFDFLRCRQRSFWFRPKSSQKAVDKTRVLCYNK